MKKRIFISRNPGPGSPLKSVEQTHEVELTGESMIHIQPIEVSKLPFADWFFFYSKNGVDNFARQWKEKWKSTLISDKIRWAALGRGTASSLTGWGIHCDFVGHGETEEIADQFLAHIKPSESVLFFRAYHSRNKLYEIVTEHREATSIPIYDNQLIKKQFPNMDIGIFTSSRNAIAFFENNPEPVIACIAIGKTTADSLIALNVPKDKILVADEPTEEAILEALLGILNSEF